MWPQSHVFPAIYLPGADVACTDHPPQPFNSEGREDVSDPFVSPPHDQVSCLARSVYQTVNGHRDNSADHRCPSWSWTRGLHWVWRTHPVKRSCIDQQLYVRTHFDTTEKRRELCATIKDFIWTGLDGFNPILGQCLWPGERNTNVLFRVSYSSSVHARMLQIKQSYFTVWYTISLSIALRSEIQCFHCIVMCNL